MAIQSDTFELLRVQVPARDKLIFPLLKKIPEVTPSSASLEIGNGVFLDVLNPDPAKISLTRIAHALSRLNRFAGFPQRSISVAEHSWHASYMVDTSDCVTVEQAAERQLQALLHDATEGSGLVDLPSPIKAMLPAYYEIEAGLAFMIGKKFGVELAKLPKAVKDVDARLCLTEKIAFIGPDGLDRPEWTGLSSRYDAFRFSFLPKWLDRIVFPDRSAERTVYYHWFMWPGRAKSLFIKRYIELAKALKRGVAV